MGAKILETAGGRAGDFLPAGSCAVSFDCAADATGGRGDGNKDHRLLRLPEML